MIGRWSARGWAARPSSHASRWASATRHLLQAGLTQISIASAAVSVDVGGRGPRHRDQLVVRRGEDGGGVARGGPDLVVLLERDVDPRRDGGGVAERGHTADH